MSNLGRGEVVKLVNRYIGVFGGYLGDFSYRTHAEFYPEYCGLDIDPGPMQGTTRERFIAILLGAGPREQAKILRGVLERFPVGATQAPKDVLREAARALGLDESRITHLTALVGLSPVMQESKVPAARHEPLPLRSIVSWGGTSPVVGSSGS